MAWLSIIIEGQVYRFIDVVPFRTMWSRSPDIVIIGDMEMYSWLAVRHGEAYGSA